MGNLSKLANVKRQLDRDERNEMNRLKAKVTEINTMKKTRLLNEKIKEIPNIEELSMMGQKFFISRYNNKCKNKTCAVMEINGKETSNPLEISIHLKEVYEKKLIMKVTT